MSKYVIGIDFGTLSGRAVLADVSDGTICASDIKEYTHGIMDKSLPSGKALPSDWALQHPLDYIEVLESTIPSVIEQSAVDPNSVIGLATDFTACTCLPVDRQLTPLCLKPEYTDRPHAYVKLWKHHAALKEAEEINYLLEKKGIINDYKYGGRISSELLLPKILQIVHEDFEIYNNAWQIMEAPDWITCMLTGTHMRSGSTACYKAMWDPENGYPSKEFYKQLHPALENIASEKLSHNICSIGGKIGSLTPYWAERLKLPAGIAVAPNIIDAHAGLVSCGAVSPGEMLLIIGTSTAQTLISETPYSGKGILGGVKGQIIPGYYALESGLASAGDTFRWFIENMVPASYSLEADKNFQGDVHALLSDKAARLSPGESGLLALNWFNGNKTPYVDVCRSGLITGLTLNTPPEAIYRALIESMGFETLSIMKHMEASGTALKKIYCCGGAAEKNPLLMQIFSEILQHRLYVVTSGQTAALGAAIYAAVAAGSKHGGYDDVKTASDCMKFSSHTVYHPRIQAEQIYKQLYPLFLQLGSTFAPARQDIMKNLKEIQQSI